jgi:hypothetical protein
LLTLFGKIISYIFILANTQQAALTACNETGLLYNEGQLVLQVAVNRTKANNTDLNLELSRPYQFNLKPCSITTGHVVIAYLAHLDSLEVPAILKTPEVKHYDALWSQERASRSCPGRTVGDVWEYQGLKPVCISEAKHIFFTSSNSSWKKEKCPPTYFKPVKHYKKIKRRC